MVHDLKDEHYRGVLCSCCRQPIPLSGALLHMENSSEAETDRMFSLRCRACEREMPYRFNAVKEFEGTPRSRTSSSDRRSKMLRHENRIARAANG